jgi:hypothetical protein
MSNWSRQAASLGIPEYNPRAFRLEAGRMRLYGGGGGGSDPTVTQQLTQSDPTMTNTAMQGTTSREIPQWLEGASQDIVSRAGDLSNQAYQGYDGQRVAQFNDLQNGVFEDIGNQQVAGQIGQATGLAGLATNQALNTGANYNPYATGQFTGDVAQQYMNPYQQNVTNTQLREADRAADIATTDRMGAATKSGAFGGSRQAVMDAEAGRNLALQKGDIQAQGLQQSYMQGQQQFNTENALAEDSRQFGTNAGLQGLNTAIQGANTLGSLGQMQFGQEMDTIKGRALAGQQQQQLNQQQLDVDYNEFLNEQKSPYENLAFYQSMAAGVPYSTTTNTASNTAAITSPGETRGVTVQTNPDDASTFNASEYMAAKGGLVALHKKGKAKKKSPKSAGLNALALHKMKS